MLDTIARSPRRRWTLVFAAVLACVLATGASAHRSDFRPGKWPSATVLIGYSSEQALETALRGRAATVVGRAPRLRTVAVRPSGDVALFASDVSGQRGIDFVQAPVARRALVEPGSHRPLFPVAPTSGSTRSPARIRARKRRALRARCADRHRRLGADLSAPDIEAKRPLTYNAIDNSRDVTDTVGHGTFVASLAAGSSSNGEGVAGVAARRG